MKISLCTYSKNRIEHVKKYFPKALESIKEDDEIVYVDYNDPQQSKKFVSSLKDERIKIVDVPNVSFWHMNHARNCAGIHASNDILFFCDIDVYITSDIIEFIRLNVTENNYVWSGFNGPLTVGSCAITKKMYQTVNGYEEMFTGWGYDDACMYQMLGMNGFKGTQLPSQKTRNNIEGRHNRENYAGNMAPFNRKLLEVMKENNIFKANFQRTIALGSTLIKNQDTR